ncbi:cupredoxin family protein [Parvibaculum sp.]|uniref:cupredoxin domain-containing protein n=1 Tax=Parvibaculum sp. TaxID=2024848 RepID=UPI00320DE326
MKTITATLLAACLALAAPAAFASAVDDGHHHGATYGEPGDAKKADRTVTIEATEIAYNVKDLTFRKGETVRFVFVNKGEQPHEFMIADAAEMAAHRQMMQEMAGMSMESMGHKSPNAVSTEPGETKELVWTFTNAGEFQFACNYPGHAEVGMGGKIIVK